MGAKFQNDINGHGNYYVSVIIAPITALNEMISMWWFKVYRKLRLINYGVLRELE